MAQAVAKEIVEEIGGNHVDAMVAQEEKVELPANNAMGKLIRHYRAKYLKRRFAAHLKNLEMTELLT